MTLPSERSATKPEARIELLAPAGDQRALRAALAAGADAVYLGLERFSARAFAGNFGPAELLEAIDRAHLWGARVHLVLNTQLKQEEMGPALRALEAPYAAGLDALIVADLGFAALVRATFPELSLHASTQLNTHSSAQLEALAGLGFRRAVLARELSLKEIGELQAHGLELEAFVHGALCYGYSGNCLFASMVGGRSGNRGRCTQACRMRYTLRRAGSAATLAAAGRLSPACRAGAELPAGRVLSASDLAALDVLPQLLAAGVSAFKIEGRMKDAGYVATATAVYREALQVALADPDGFLVLPEWRKRLEQSFSRGFTAAHLQGRHAEVRSRDRGGHRGVQVGRVEQIDEAQGRVVVRLSEPVGAGDVLTIFTPWGQSEPVRVPAEALGGAPAAGQSAAERLVLQVRERVAVKDRVFRLSAAAADAFTEDAVAGRVVARPQLFKAELQAAAGEAPRLRVHAGPLEVEVSGKEPLAVAERAHLNPGRARDAVGALGGTPYRLAEFHAQLEGDPFLPVGALKELRRRALAELDARRLASLQRALIAVPQTDEPPLSATAGPFVRLPLPVVIRIRPDETPVSAPHVAVVALDLDVGDDPQSIAAVMRRLATGGLGVRCRPPEVLFDGDLPWWSEVAALPWEAVYARSLAHLSGGSAARILEYPLQGLNAGAALLLGPSAVVAGPEASLPEVADLAGRLRAAGSPMAVEAFVFGRQQLLATRDVLGRAEGLVAEGARSFLELMDAKDFVFPAEAAPEGTRIFNSRVTNLAAAQAELAAAGISAAIVVQRDLGDEEREAFATGGLAALAAFAGRERSTTGHLFRGVD